MTAAAILQLAEHHEQAAAAQFKAANGMGDCPAAERFRVAGVRHLTWASDLCGLVSGDVAVDAPADQLRHGLTMAARVIAAMERERRELCQEIARLKMEGAHR
jgi:hypothetical protein